MKNKTFRRRAALILLLFALAALCACSKDEAAGYASVNGEIITAEEIEYFKGRCRSEIINEYAGKYGVEDFSDFWDRDFDGMTPAQSLEKRALDEAVSAKLKLVMMRENGIYDDISFAVLSEMAEKFNSENENASGVVGIKTIDADSFYTYYISTGELELKRILADGEYDALLAERIKEAKIEVFDQY